MTAARASLLLLALLALPAFADGPHGSAWRPEYDKEKNGPHGECLSDWRELQPGLDYRAIRCLGDRNDLDLQVVRIDTERWTVDTAVAHDAFAREIAKDRDARFAINASFFDHSRSAEGLIVRGGKEVQALRKVSWQGVFLLTRKGRPMIVPTSDWAGVRRSAWMAGKRSRTTAEQESSTVPE